MERRRGSLLQAWAACLTLTRPHCTYNVLSMIKELALGLFVTCLAAPALPGKAQSAAEARIDSPEMERTEELSESLANQLLDFSVAVTEGNVTFMEQSLAEELEATPLPELGTGSSQWERNGSRIYDLQLQQSNSERVSRSEWLEQWLRFVGPFSRIEDSRFKVSGARFDEQDSGSKGEGQLKFFLVGEKSSDHLLWVRGNGRLEVHRPAGSKVWLISTLRLSDLSVAESSPVPFSEISAPAGLALALPRYGSPGNDDFVYHGAATADLNRDGLVDLFVTGIGRNYLYLNQGKGRFKEAAGRTGLEITRTATSPLLLDFDNDGDLDLFLAALGDQMLFENRLIPEGKLVFRDISEEAGVAHPAIGFSATAGDVNNDGWTDLYVTSYNLYGRVMPDSWHQAENGTPNLLFLNQKDGTFRESGRSWTAADRRWSYAAQFADVNADGKLDLYVANDFGSNALLINQGKDFRDNAANSGTLDVGNGMGVSFGDYDNDGDLDLYVSNMSSTAGNRILDRLFPEGSRDDNLLKKLASGNTLFQQNAPGLFSDVTDQVGPFPGGWAFGGVFVDTDNDGWEDLYTPNGFVSGKSMKDT